MTSSDGMMERVRAAIARDYGRAARLSPLPGEYDLNYAADAEDGRFVFKVMRAGCDPDFVDMQIAAMERVRAAGLAASVPAVIRTRSGAARISLVDETGAERIAWAIGWMPGEVLARVEPWTPALAASIGALLARLDLALSGFEHVLLARPQKWNLLQAGWIAKEVAAHDDPGRRARIKAIAARFADDIAPRLVRRPLAAIYNDANDMNVFVRRGVDGALRATGLIDFGDLVSAPRACEVAVALAYAMMGPGDPLARAAALAGAYHKVAALDAEDFALLPALVETRLAVSVTNAAINRRAEPDNAYLQISARPAWRLLDYLEALGEGAFADALLAAAASDDPAAAGATTKSVLVRRRRVAPDNQTLFYDEPLRFVRGERHFLYDAEGADYLDVYNNVPHVGHAHPRVVDAVARQMARITANTRYLQDVHVDYAERMLAKLPPTLTRIVFLNSASEANELALRLARAATGARDMIVMDHCYHGNTTGAMDMSPYKFNHPKSKSAKPDWVHVAPQPDCYRGARRGADAAAGYVEDARRVIDKAREDGRRLAGFISECLPSVGGQIVPPDGYLHSVYGLIRAAGGVAIADDVQTALGRLGGWFFGFEQQNAAPDIVVMGKPLGNGFPLATVAMTEAIAAAFAEGPEFFSTFGGSSASCAAGLAVLDVLHEEGLQENARRVGDRLHADLKALQAQHEVIGDVRGFGFFLGVELVEDREKRTPATAAARIVKNRLRARRILLGTEGPDDNVLKIRPPMTFDDDAAGRLIAEIDRAVGEVT